MENSTSQLSSHKSSPTYAPPGSPGTPLIDHVAQVPHTATLPGREGMEAAPQLSSITSVTGDVVTDVVYHLGRTVIDTARSLLGYEPRSVPKEGPPAGVTIDTSGTSEAQGVKTVTARSVYSGDSPPAVLEPEACSGEGPPVPNTHAPGTEGKHPGVLGSLVSGFESLIHPATPHLELPNDATTTPPTHGFAAAALPEVQQTQQARTPMDKASPAIAGELSGRAPAGAHGTGALGVGAHGTGVPVVGGSPLARRSGPKHGLPPSTGLNLQDVGGYGRGIIPGGAELEEEEDPYEGSEAIPVVPYTSTEELLRQQQQPAAGAGG